MTTVAEVLDEAEERLLAANGRFGYQGFERVEAEELLEHALGRRPRRRELLDAKTRRRYNRLVARRATGEPMPLVLGWTEFHGLRLSVQRGAFIPRPTSEFLATQAIRRARRRERPVVVDVATGIGPVALAVADAVPHARVYGLDLSKEAVAAARRNARALGLRNVTFLAGDLFAPLPAKLRADVITMHPPYVASDEIAELPDEIRLFEPVSVLTDGSDGFDLIRRVVSEAPAHLREDGWLCLEVGSYAARKLRSIVAAAGFRGVRSTKGPMPQNRVIVGRAPRRSDR